LGSFENLGLKLKTGLTLYGLHKVGPRKRRRGLARCIAAADCIIIVNFFSFLIPTSWPGRGGGPAAVAALLSPFTKHESDNRKQDE
jgi:hypothetical protein